MSEKSMIFNNKNIKKSNFTKIKNYLQWKT